MNVGEILNYINEIAPFAYAEEWDNAGLMAGSRTAEVRRILLCLDITSAVVEEAVGKKADLIISHHPFLFSKLNRLDLDTVKGRQIDVLIRSGISVISAHTNLDVAQGGVNDTLAEILGLVECQYLKAYVPAGIDTELGLGKVGTIPDGPAFGDFIRDIKKRLGIENLRIAGPQPEKVRTAAVFCGSFDNDLNSIKKVNADVLVTGDMKYHTAMEAAEMGLCIIDVGHFASEIVILAKLQKLLAEKFDTAEAICSKVERDPFIFA